MRAGVVLYSIWAAVIAVLFVAAAFRGYSPFASPSVPRSAGYYGPNHK
jgi:hypothetical protein